MYAIRNKKTKAVIYINHSPLSKNLTDKEIYPEFDPKTMEIGKTEKGYVPAYFNINNQGEIVELTLKEQVDAGIPVMPPHQKLIGGKIVDKTITELIKGGITSLDEVKKQFIAAVSDMAFERRRKLVPDYKLQNAALGVYDEQTLADYKRTIQVFRDEVHRIEALVEQAQTIGEIEAIVPNFPGGSIESTQPDQLA